MEKKLNSSFIPSNKIISTKKQRKIIKLNIHKIHEKERLNQKKKRQNTKKKIHKIKKPKMDITSLQNIQKNLFQIEKTEIPQFEHDTDYYLQDKINFLEDLFPSSFEELQKKDLMEMEKKLNKKKKLNFREEDRIKVLIQMYRFITCIQQQEKNIPDNYYFSAVALLDLYLDNTDDFLSIKDIEKIMVVIMIILAKIDRIVFFNTNFKDYLTESQISELEVKIINAIDLELYPIKNFDYFECLYLHINTIEKKNPYHFKILIRELKEIYKESAFLLTLFYNSNKINCSTNFVSCMIYSYDKFIENGDVDVYFRSFMNQLLNNIKRQFNYSEKDYIISEGIFKWSISLLNY